MRIVVKRVYKFLTATVLALCLLVVLTAGSSQALTIPYAVDDYIPVLFKDAQLVVGGSMDFYGNGNSNDNDSAGGASNIVQSSDSQTDRFNFETDLFYRRQYTTVSKWYDYYARLSADLSRYKNTYKNSSTSLSLSTYKSESEEKNTNINPRIYQQIDLGKYVSGDFMVSARASVDFSYRKRSNSESKSFTQRIDIAGTTATRYTGIDNSEDPSDYKSLDLSGELLFGRGRMYDGVFAFTAISMIEELDSKDLLLRTPTADEMEELTEIIYQNRLLHAIDYRIREVEIFSEINAYLNSKRIVEISNPMTTPVIRDVWEYFPDYQRPFGLMVRGGFGVMHSYDNDNGTRESTNRDLQETYDTGNPSVVTVVSDDLSNTSSSSASKNTRTFPYFTLMVEKNKPINNRLQLNLAAQGWIYFSTKDTSYYENRNYDGDSLTNSYNSGTSVDYESITRFSLSGDLNYYFDNRTSAGVSASYNRFDYDRMITSSSIYLGSPAFGDTLSTTDNGGYDFNISANLTYRISIPTTFRANASYSKSTSNLFSHSLGNFSNDGYYFSLGIEHHLF